MALIKNVMTREEAEKTEFTEIPVGDYYCVLAETAEFNNDQRQESGIIFKWQILSGEFEGKQKWDYLAFTSQNEIVMRMASKRYYEICDAYGKVEEDAEKFHGMEIIMNLKAAKKGNYINIAGYSEVKGAKKPDTSFPSTSTGSISDDVEGGLWED